MKTNKLFKLGQSLVEYAVILACFIIAVTVMGVYFKRGVSGSLRNSADMLGRQYDPQAISSSITTTVQGVSYSTTVRAFVDEDGDGTNDKMYSDTYSVTGPNEEDIVGEDGAVVIKADPDRDPEVTTTTGSETISPDDDGKLW